MKTAAIGITFLIFLSLDCFGVTVPIPQGRNMKSAYTQHREQQDRYDRERKSAFQNYKRNRALYTKERESFLRERLQTLDRESFGERTAELRKQWEMAQKEYNKIRNRNLNLYLKIRDSRGKRNPLGNSMELIKKGREFAL